LWLLGGTSPKKEKCRIYVELVIFVELTHKVASHGFLVLTECIAASRPRDQFSNSFVLDFHVVMDVDSRVLSISFERFSPFDVFS
jgi:hypothetical protein